MSRYTDRRARWDVRSRERVPFLACLALVSAGAFVPIPALRAQEPAMVLVTVQMRDDATQAPLMGALVRVPGQARPYITRVDGQVAFELPAGKYVITVRKGGYSTLTHELDVSQPEEVTLRLKRLVDVEAGLPATLLVRVREAGTGRSIEGAAVSLVGGETRITDKRGNVQFATLSGEARINAEMIGYANRTEPVSVHSDGTTVVDLAMAVDAVVLPPIQVEVRSRHLLVNGVYRRIDSGQVMRLLTREDLEKFPVSFLSDAFSNVPGVQVDRASLGDTRLFGPARGDPNGCELKVYVDGMPTDMNIDSFSPEMVEMAEIYWGLRTPIQYRGVNASNCGVVLLWTRRGAG
ncbi:MAG: TonB-dependent receptor [Gemmatimonadota bacterium]|nr:TonB-dependent receptor [Gemmatimonadota bacterium]MDE2985959.1 TonB-dependent receptor [Gemmatimonadota bacterium]